MLAVGTPGQADGQVPPPTGMQAHSAWEFNT